MGLLVLIIYCNFHLQIISTDLSTKLMNNILTILLAMVFCSSIIGQTKIAGKITDADKQPLPGANIYLQDTYDGVSSETDGTFSFTTDEEGEGILVISFVGYKTHIAECCS